MTVTLERRVRRLEKQVTILKAKVKANDLWKLELQTWIYKKFKKLIIDQVACSPSSGDSSESQANSELSDEEEYKVTPRRRRKRARLHLTSSQSSPNRPGPKRRVAVVIRQVEDGQASVDKDVDGSTPPGNLQPSATSTVGDRNSNTSASTSQLVSVSTSTTTVAKSVEKQEEPSTSVKVEASSGSEGVESDFGGKGHLGTSDDDPLATNAPSRLNTVGNKEPPATTTMTTYVEAAARRRRLPGTDKYLEVRPDLQKYFQFYGDTNNEEEELKVVCLVNGCGSILRIKPTCKWSNPVRHLAGVHKIQEYLEQAPSALRTVGYR